MTSTDRNVDSWFTRPARAVHAVAAVDFRGDLRDAEIIDFLADSDHYTSSFGAQWAKYRNVQIDRFNGTHLTLDHLTSMTFGSLDVFRSKTVLEIGSGAGRYTDHLVDLAATVITVDPSAIGSNVALGAPNLVPVRGDIFDLPIQRNKIDVVFCRGVLQHTGHTRRALKRLFDYVKPGGVVLFDVYPLKWFTPLYVKYWLRPFTRHLPASKFISLAEGWVPRLLSLKNKHVVPFLPKNKLGEKLAAQIVPIADFTLVPALRPATQVEWSILDTVDMYTPRYDRPMTWRQVMRMLHEVGATNIRGNAGGSCFMATAPTG